MGTDGSGAGPALGLQPRLKPPPDRLYGRQRGHTLRPRQERLLALTLPRLRLPAEVAARPSTAFARPVDEVWVEIGFGGGEHAAAQSSAHSNVGLIACEVFLTGICSLLSRLVADGEEQSGDVPANLRVWDADARLLLAALPDASINRLFLLFPDPWPKARHAKRRFVHPALLPMVARVMAPGGEWRIATDDPTYQAWTHDVLGRQSLFEVPEPATARPPDWPPTRYEAKALRGGRRPLYWTLRRRAEPVLRLENPHARRATSG